MAFAPLARSIYCMFKNILVLPRSGDPKQPAMRRARDCATAHTKLRIFDVVYEPLIDGYLGNRQIYEPLRSRVLLERQERVDALAKSLRTEGLTGSAKAVWDHPLEEAVARELELEAADLVVTAADTQAGLSQSDWRLLSRSPAPVLFVKSSGERRYRHIVAAVDPFHAHAKPAELDAEILANAKNLQALTGASVTVLHCYTPIEFFGTDIAPPAAAFAPDPSAVRRLAASAGFPESTARVATGAPHVVLLEMLERGEADLVVMGALARGRVKDFLIGSTAERLLQHARHDLLAVHVPAPPR
jgi:universal stress protein E